MKRRIVICLGIILALCLLGDAIAMLCLHSSIRKLTALVDSHRIQSMRADLVSSAVRIETDLLAYRTGHRHHAAQRDDHLRRFRESLHRCTTCHHGPSIQAKHDALHATFEAYQAKAAKLYGGGDPTDRAALEEDVQALVDRLVKQTTQMSDQADRHLVTRSSDVIASVHSAWIVLLGTLAVVLVAGGIVAFHLMGRLTKPVEAMLESIERVRQGDLDHRFSINADEEFRTLANAFNQAYTNLKNVQDSVIQAEKMASVGKLAAGVAHEVGNPLASISSIAQLMRRDCTSDPQAKRIDLIMAQIGRISRIVHDLLSFARPKSDQKQGQVVIGALLDQATTLLGYDRRAEKIRITQQLDINLRPVRGDSDKLLLVFTNILINAFDAIASKGNNARGAINISAQQEIDAAVVRFQDNGPGMSQEQIAYAFEPFFTTKAPGDGTGLGLWICYEAIQRHNGTIHIDSRVGEGTTVVIRLPTEPPEIGAGNEEETHKR